MTEEELTYEELATHYDRLYHDKPYAAESARVIELLRDRGAEDGARLLDVGTGTGQHVQHLSGTFQVTGVDVHEPVLDIARERVPEARFVEGDIRTLDLDERFDALTCLFGVIGYVETWANLDTALERVAAHLAPGAPFVIESWVTPAVFEQIEGRPVLRTYDGDDLTLARVAIPRRVQAETAELAIEWLIARPNAGIQRYSETHRMGVFDDDRTLELMSKHDLAAEVDEDGLTDRRILYVGTRRA